MGCFQLLLFIWLVTFWAHWHRQVTVYITFKISVRPVLRWTPCCIKQPKVPWSPLEHWCTHTNLSWLTFARHCPFSFAYLAARIFLNGQIGKQQGCLDTSWKYCSSQISRKTRMPRLSLSSFYDFLSFFFWRIIISHAFAASFLDNNWVANTTSVRISSPGLSSPGLSSPGQPSPGQPVHLQTTGTGQQPSWPGHALVSNPPAPISAPPPRLSVYLVQ